ncbi:TetR/AcrR family transcriptional regulator [Streptomyces sp. NPDC058045]|uniref:TetR/AcrR family transcriptional regulator n=1 Tax=Streptomyces sp. NPDC058045 TaxID=3346311 RepID=UPI0036E7A6FD
MIRPWPHGPGRSWRGFSRTCPFPSKSDLLAACLKRRDGIAREALHTYAARHEDPVSRALAPFDFLNDWFLQPGFHGCVFAGAFGEAGSATLGVSESVRTHKQHLLTLFTDLARQTGVPAPGQTGHQLAVLFDGAMAIATFTRDTDAALHARQATHTSSPPPTELTDPRSFGVSGSRFEILPETVECQDCGDHNPLRDPARRPKATTGDAEGGGHSAHTPPRCPLPSILLLTNCAER